MDSTVFNQLLHAFLNYKGVGFVSLQYRSLNGELSKRLINIGAKLDNAKKKDLELLNNGIAYVPSDKYTKADWDNALLEIKYSLTRPDARRSEGQRNTYVILHEENGSVRYNSNIQEVYLFGKSEKKEILEAGSYKEVKSSPKTLAKKEINKLLKSSKFRTFILKNVRGTVKVNKQIINTEDGSQNADVIEIVFD